MKTSNLVLVYINSAIVISVAILCYVFDFQISDMFQEFGVLLGKWVNLIYAVYCIFYLFIIFALSYIYSLFTKRKILGFLLLVFLFLHMTWFVFYLNSYFNM